MLVNLYWLENGASFYLRGMSINEATEIAARVLRNGGEITSIINQKDDE